MIVLALTIILLMFTMRRVPTNVRSQMPFALTESTPTAESTAVVKIHAGNADLFMSGDCDHIERNSEGC